MKIGELSGVGRQLYGASTSEPLPFRRGVSDLKAKISKSSVQMHRTVEVQRSRHWPSTLPSMPSVSCYGSSTSESGNRADEVPWAKNAIGRTRMMSCSEFLGPRRGLEATHEIAAVQLRWL